MVTAREPLAADQLLELIRAEHHPVWAGVGGYQPRCTVGCGPHPCQTYRTACGHPDWPNDRRETA